MDAQPNHEIMHALCLGEAQCATHSAFDPGPQMEVFALDVLCICLAPLRLLGVEMPRVSVPAIGGKPGETTGRPQLLALREGVVFHTWIERARTPCGSKP
jgi:hypothetical protein